MVDRSRTQNNIELANAYIDVHNHLSEWNKKDLVEFILDFYGEEELIEFANKLRNEE